MTLLYKVDALDVVREDHAMGHGDAARLATQRLFVAGRAALSLRRQWAGFALAVIGLPLLTWVLYRLRGDFTVPSDVLLFLALVIAVALVGGLWPALLAAVAGHLLLNFYFTQPYDTFAIDSRDDVVNVVVFLISAVSVSAVVDQAARRSREAARASAEASTLATVAGSVLRGARPLTALLARLREEFGLESVTLLEQRQTPPAGWRIAATVGGPPCLTPADGDAALIADADLMLVLKGARLPAADRRVVAAFAAQAAVALRHERLAEQAARARPLEEADRMRTALLAAVSHDLRTPLASAKAAVESLRSRDVPFTDTDREELLATADESLDRLSRLVDNLLDMSRLQAGAIGVTFTVLGVEEAVPTALDEIGEAARTVTVSIPDDLDAVYADPGLLQRVLVNVIGNALRFSPPGRPPRITAGEDSGQVCLRIIDRGPGIPLEQREQVFLPFQRLGDRDNDTGVGLGLALSRGLVEAMGGTLRPQTTPGGGLTMVICLPTVKPAGSPDEFAIRVGDGS